MKALTIWQPWASLIMLGAKPYEFRGWAAPRAIWGQRIGVHAGARPVRKDEIADLILRLRSAEAWSTALRPEIALPFLERAHANPGSLARASMLCTAVLGEPRRAADIVGEFGGQMNDSDRQEHASWAWPMREVQPLEPFVPVKGAQGFWEWAA
jgi:hypothetical protein